MAEAVLFQMRRGGLISALILSMFFLGIWLRLLAWRQTETLRVEKDVVNGFYWGGEAVFEGRKLAGNSAAQDSWVSFFKGYFALYDQVKGDACENHYHLDYPPLRLLVMSLWANHELEKPADAGVGRPEDVKPLLLFNLSCEVTTAVGIFLLVRSWLAGAKTSSRWLRGIGAERRGWLCGMAAACVAWLEPSLILDAHAWPQWDVWCLPFFLFAALSASTGRWLCCGCLLAFGAMFKGQLLIVAPFFVMWPAAEKQWANVSRVLAGFSATVAIVASPWLLRHPSACFSVIGATAAFCALLLTRELPNKKTWLCGFFAAATLVAGILGHGSFAWAETGFLYGAEEYPYVVVGRCYNLPALLKYLASLLEEARPAHDFGGAQVAAPKHMHSHAVIILIWISRLIYMGALWLCACGASRLARNRDPRILIALATPWLLMFALLAQIHERYLMWGAVVSATALGVNARLSLIHFLFSAASSVMIVHVMLIDKGITADLPLIHFLDQTTPWGSLLVLLGVGIYLWESCSERRLGLR